MVRISFIVRVGDREYTIQYATQDIAGAWLASLLLSLSMDRPGPGQRVSSVTTIVHKG